MRVKITFVEWLGLLPIRDFDFSKARWLGGIIGVVCVLIMSIAILLGILNALSLLSPINFFSESASPAEKGVSTVTLLVAILSAPIILWRTYISQQQANFQKESLMTDRIAKAVEQIGADKICKTALYSTAGDLVLDELPSGERLPTIIEYTQPNKEVRMGGILALERIAADTVAYDRGRDYTSVMNILVSYLRENAPFTAKPASMQPLEGHKVRSDIQAIVDVLRRRSDKQILLERELGYKFELSHCDLSNLDLSGIDLRGARLINCNLEGVVANYSNFAGARFSGSSLNYSSFHHSNLTGCNFNFCILNKTNNNAFRLIFFKSNLNGSSFVGADFTAVDFLHGPGQSNTFGSSDTKLSFHLDDLRKDAMKIIEERDWEHSTEMFEEEHLNRFRYWQNFPAADFATGPNYERLKSDLGLTGWPYD